jgi:hypothetical protein
MSRAKLAPLIADANRDCALGAAVRALVEKHGAVMIERTAAGASVALPDGHVPGDAIWWRDAVQGASIDEAAAEAAKEAVDG